MASKADFTEVEWQTLRWAVTDTMTYLSMADSGFWDMFKEANAAAHYIVAAKQTSESVLVRELAADIRTKRDKEVTGKPDRRVGRGH